ncbi:MAG: cupredoxin domain-containing protein [bacterium]|nr:cupredoxin domain-containing protein [bacterium]
MNKGILVGVGVLVAASVIIFLATRGSYKAPTNQVPAPGNTSVEEKVVAPQEEVREIVITGNEYSFSPSTIDLSSGETVKLTFKNTGAMPHNLMIPDLGVSTKTIAGGASDSVLVKAEKTGSFTFYCGVAGHRALGMEGTTVVK